MKYIILNDDNSVQDCLSDFVDGAIEISDEEAAKFKNTETHSELKYVGGVLVANTDYVKPPKAKSEFDKIWEEINALKEKIK